MDKILVVQIKNTPCIFCSNNAKYKILEKNLFLCGSCFKLFKEKNSTKEVKILYEEGQLPIPSKSLISLRSGGEEINSLIKSEDYYSWKKRKKFHKEQVKEIRKNNEVSRFFLSELASLIIENSEQEILTSKESETFFKYSFGGNSVITSILNTPLYVIFNGVKYFL